MMHSRDYYECPIDCNLCGDTVKVMGKDYGDGWSEPPEFVPIKEPALCERCDGGYRFTLTFKVVCEEDFSKLKGSEHWAELFEGFDAVHLLEVKVDKE